MLVPIAFMGSFLMFLFMAIRDLEWNDVVNMANDIHDEILSTLRKRK